MITRIIDLLNSLDVPNSSENIQIANGKRCYSNSWIDNLKILITDMKLKIFKYKNKI